MIESLIASFKKSKVSYDLAFLFELNGYSPEEAKSICDFIDLNRGVSIRAKKIIGHALNSNQLHQSDFEFIASECPNLEISKCVLIVENNENYEEALAKLLINRIVTKYKLSRS